MNVKFALIVGGSTDMGKATARALNRPWFSGDDSV
jgi:NAD(P)-dependent dehydrogenase (short-subunit alcohol dehydrogenase family)